MIADEDYPSWQIERGNMEYCVKQDGDEYKVLDVEAREIVFTSNTRKNAELFIELKFLERALNDVFQRLTED